MITDMEFELSLILSVITAGLICDAKWKLFTIPSPVNFLAFHCLVISVMRSSRKRKKHSSNSNVVGSAVLESVGPSDLQVVSDKQSKKRASLRKAHASASASSHVSVSFFLHAQLTPIYTISAPFDVSGVSPLYRDSGDCTSVCIQGAPRFLQLYIYDTDHEVENRMGHFGGRDSGRLSEVVVTQLVKLLDSNNALVMLFCTARDKCAGSEVPTFKVCLYSLSGSIQHALPTSDAIGAIVFDSDPQSISDYDVIIEPRSQLPNGVNKLHPLYMSLQFPLMFFFGEPGFHPDLKLRAASGSQGGRVRKMSMNMFYNYQIHDRLQSYNLILRLGRLFQQYVVTAYCSIELDRMDYIRNKQNDIRAEYLSGLYEAIDRGDKTGPDVGSMTILPASFTGGPRYMYSHYLDALAISRVFGNPIFFVTFTCNVKWPEIARYLKPFPHLSPSDRADIVARVFHMKVNEFINFLKDERPLGHVRGGTIAHPELQFPLYFMNITCFVVANSLTLFSLRLAVLYTTEFQKRGLPHCHTLVWVHSSVSAAIRDNLDDYISAELPDPRIDFPGYAVISATMMHGPCVLANKRASCNQDFSCSKKFPKKYIDKTYFDDNGRAHYRRRNTGIYTTRAGVHLDNSYVVPYNRLLCMTFQAHINVECCGTTSLIKYLFKYISKGTDRMAVRIAKPIGSDSRQSQQQTQPVDEIKNFIDVQFICPHEACWRIFNFPIHHREPAVQILAVHLENMQLVKFPGKQPLRAIVENNEAKKTTLTEWLNYNASSVNGSHLTYLDFPTEFVWYESKKGWQRRANLKKPSIGRISYIHPAYGEAFFLRMLLCHRKGCKSFADIRTVNQILHNTYRSACEAAGLLGDDREWSAVLEEASVSATSSQLRSLFAHILSYCTVTNPLALWKNHWKLMGDDIPLRTAANLNMSHLHINADDLHNFVLYEVEILLNQCSKSICDFALPSLPADLLANLANRLIMEERNYDRAVLNAERLELERQMNSKQKQIYDLITSASLNEKTEHVFVYGHDGTGKTFL
ncbi:uncharacterized protein [Rutidosis leptorrhynchoides]|uniref:uncharacterized protein n=1 Tax=Rutidosis leptorrhynchoides TaxID=125765 RepID=UPI003A98E0F9